MANWVTAEEASALTGTAVFEQQIDVAQGVIDTFSGVVVEAAANLTTRDRRLLRMATAYQTVWQAAQVDVMTRTDVKQVEQDGAKFTPDGEDALLLAPLARRCLGQLSWRRTRSVRIRAGRRRYSNIEAYQAAWLADQVHDADWQPA